MLKALRVDMFPPRISDLGALIRRAFLVHHGCGQEVGWVLLIPEISLPMGAAAAGLTLAGVGLHCSQRGFAPLLKIVWGYDLAGTATPEHLAQMFRNQPVIVDPARLLVKAELVLELVMTIWLCTNVFWMTSGFGDSTNGSLMHEIRGKIILNISYPQS